MTFKEVKYKIVESSKNENIIEVLMSNYSPTFNTSKKVDKLQMNEVNQEHNIEKKPKIDG